MLIKRLRGWEMPERDATPESVYLNRRHFMTSAAAGSILAATTIPRAFAADAAPLPEGYPAKRNETYSLDRPLTEEKFATNYNNFYEFGTSKDIAPDAQALKLSPWQVKIDGLVENELTLDFDDLIKKMPLEERLYRHRCVETWAMAVPWTGFALKSLVALAKPLSSAKYLKMQTFKDPSVAPEQKQFWYPWPYTEGLTLAEANHDLAFIATGLYGKPLPKQNGAPLRLAVPWKYGFKSIKSIVRFSFVEERPKTFWEGLQGSEYGFWANVNPEVNHPRWSQASERLLGVRERRATLLFNGYGEFVADLYKDLKNEKLYI